MGTWKYIGVLTACIAGVAGYAYAESEVRTVFVTDKYIQDVQMRRGRSAQRFVVTTEDGDLPILKFPLLGYATGVDGVYDSIVPGTSIRVRVAQWPPRLLGKQGKPYILEIY